MKTVLTQKAASFHQQKKHHEKSGVPSKVLALLSTDFDRVIHLLSKSVGIGISNNQAIDLVLSDDSGREFYRETITFVPTHFMNLINKKEATYRNEVLVEFGKNHF